MQIYIVKSGCQTGPFSVEQIQSMLGAGMVDLADSAWIEGLSTWLPLCQILNVPPPIPLAVASPSFSLAVKSSAGQSAATFVYIPIWRFTLMSVITYGLYQNYWMYRNWRFLKQRHGLQIQPFWRGIFGVFYVHSLFKYIRKEAGDSGDGIAGFSPGLLATGWLILSVLSFMIGLVSTHDAQRVSFVLLLISIRVLVPVQKYINAFNEAMPSRPQYDGWSVGQTVCCVLGILVVVATINE